MSATNKLQNAVRFGNQVGTAAIAAVILGSSFLGHALAADKAATMPMGSMEMHKSMMSGMKGMESTKMTGDTDRDFATMMKLHHQGAIDMAQMELKNGKDAKMQAIAKRIIKAQQKEIKEFDQWLAKHK